MEHAVGTMDPFTIIWAVSAAITGRETAEVARIRDSVVSLNNFI
jgi:hypothetical protein